MAVSVVVDYGNSANIKDKLQTLIKNASPSTMHTATIIELTGDFLLALLMYE